MLQSQTWTPGGGTFAPVRTDGANQTLRDRVNSRTWFHRIDLGQGVITPGFDDSPGKLPHMHIPERLDGWEVLDVGAYDGFFSFECERRGASRVVAADKFCWTAPKGTMGDGEGFRIAKEALNSRVIPHEIFVEDLTPEAVGQFDLVLFLGVLYHAPDPFRYLRTVRQVCRKMCIIETHVDAQDINRPAAIFYPGTTLNHDASNWWGPNNQCVIEMAKEAGFARCELITEWANARSLFHAFV